MARKQHKKFSADVTARLLILNASGYGEEKARDVSRFRISRESIRRISGWKRLSESFIGQVVDEMAELGWLLFDLNDTEFGAIQLNKVQSWVKLGAARVAHFRKNPDPEGAVYDAYDETFDSDWPFDLDEE